jgi:hypothetical protein
MLFGIAIMRGAAGSRRPESASQGDDATGSIEPPLAVAR